MPDSPPTCPTAAEGFKNGKLFLNDPLRQVRAKKVDRAILRSQWGERHLVSLYAVAIEINRHRFAAVWVVGDELGNEIVIGRNVLNRLRLLLDGPAAMTEVISE